MKTAPEDLTKLSGGTDIEVVKKRKIQHTTTKVNKLEINQCNANKKKIYKKNKNKNVDKKYQIQVV